MTMPSTMPEDELLAHMHRLNRLSAAKRGAKKQIKERLQSEELPLHMLLLNPPEVILDLRIDHVLAWGRRWGNHRARLAMRGLVLGHERVGSLPLAKRQKLALRVAIIEHGARARRAREDPWSS